MHHTNHTHTHTSVLKYFIQANHLFLFKAKNSSAKFIPSASLANCFKTRQAYLLCYDYVLQTGMTPPDGRMS